MKRGGLRASFVVPIAGGVAGAIIAVGVAAGVPLASSSSSPTEPVPTTQVESTDETEEGEDTAAGVTAAAADEERPAPLDVVVIWDGDDYGWSGVAQSAEQVDSLGPQAPGSVDVAGPGAVTADREVTAFGQLVGSLGDSFAELQSRLTVDSLMITGILLPGVSEDDVSAAIDDAGLDELTRQLELTAADAA